MAYYTMLLIQQLALLFCFFGDFTNTVVYVRGEECNFANMYNFGGSDSDTGGMSAAFFPLSSPNGRTFFKKPAGRASDGRLLIDFMAEYLKLPHLSAYLNSLEANFTSGANFAELDATICAPDAGTYWQNGISPFKFPVQVFFHFDQFKNRTIDLYNQGKDHDLLPKPDDFSKSIYTIDIGYMDFTFGIQHLGEEVFRSQQIPNITENCLAPAVRALYDKGARSFWIQNARPVGCLPNTTVSMYNPNPDLLDSNGCLKSQNEIVSEFNKQLKNKVIELRSELQEATLTYVDLYTVEYDLIANATRLGFVNPMKICCGIHDNGQYVKCGTNGTINQKQVFADSCENPNQYISWDGIHRTEAANNWIANRILNGSASDPPLPITRACSWTNG